MLYVTYLLQITFDFHTTVKIKATKECPDSSFMSNKFEVLNSTIPYNLKTHVSVVCIGELQCLTPWIDILNLKNIKDDKKLRSFMGVYHVENTTKKVQNSLGPNVSLVSVEIYGKSFRTEWQQALSKYTHLFLIYLCSVCIKFFGLCLIRVNLPAVD